MAESIRNPDGTYMSPDQIIDDMVKQIDAREGATEEWQRMTRDEVRSHHHSLGQWIRNTYGLWHMGNPHVAQNPKPNAQGIIDDPKFPDQISDDVIGRVWDRMQKKKKEA